MSGIVDRVDKSRDNLNIFDYKMASRVDNLQMAIYHELLKSQFKRFNLAIYTSFQKGI